MASALVQTIHRIISDPEYRAQVMTALHASPLGEMVLLTESGPAISEVLRLYTQQRVAKQHAEPGNDFSQDWTAGTSFTHAAWLEQ